MNKNYKSNLKTRNIEKEHNKRIDFKEYKVTRSISLLEYLIEDLKFNRSKAKSLLSHHLISIDGAPISQFNFLLSKNDIVIISKNPIKTKKRKNIPIIYEDDEFIVIDKPYGLLSNASDTEKNSTAYRMVMDYVQSKDKHNRIYLVHRLDKETSGVLLFAKNEKIKNLLIKDWNNTIVKRGYYAVVEGILENKSDHLENYLMKNKLNMMYVVNKPFSESVKAITEYKVIKEGKKYSLLDVNILTGKKNQIRVMLGNIGHYILGDDKYGEPDNPINRLCLHSYELSLKHPITNKKYIFKSEMPKEFKQLV